MFPLGIVVGKEFLNWAEIWADVQSRLDSFHNWRPTLDVPPIRAREVYCEGPIEYGSKGIMDPKASIAPALPSTTFVSFKKPVCDWRVTIKGRDARSGDWRYPS